MVIVICDADPNIGGSHFLPFNTSISALAYSFGLSLTNLHMLCRNWYLLDGLVSLSRKH